MKNLLTAKQIKDLDAYTIAHKKIKSIDLMENAAKAFVKLFCKEVGHKKAIAIFCGTGNNGGDGLAIARLLLQDGYKNTIVYIARFSARQSDDFTENLKRLRKLEVKIVELAKADDLANFKTNVVIDAILGSGLNKPLTGEYAKLIKIINQSQAKIISVDVPTGLPSDGEIKKYNGIKAHLTITFQIPKINFLFPESALAHDRFELVKIGLDKAFIKDQASHFKLLTKKDIRDTYQSRKLFTHKGTYGHALIVAGSNNTMGAAILATTSCVYSGAGLTTVMLPKSGLIALNTKVPEAMAWLYKPIEIKEKAIDKYTIVAIGPGWGISAQNLIFLKQIIALNRALVLDADALNLLGSNKDLLKKLPTGTILTPHVKEFDRLFGAHQTWWARVETARQKAQELQIVIVLKNQFTFICLPTGDVWINPTGAPAMAGGGMGDVLTGIITAFRAQGYSPANAAMLGVYLHGKAGEELAKNSTVVVAEQVAKQLAITLKNTIR